MQLNLKEKWSRFREVWQAKRMLKKYAATHSSQDFVELLADRVPYVRTRYSHIFTLPNNAKVEVFDDRIEISPAPRRSADEKNKNRA